MRERFERLLGRRPEGAKRDWSARPRLAGHTEPYYSTNVRDLFVEVLVKSSAVHTPLLRSSESDPVRALDIAVEVASMRCNTGLERRLRLYRNVAVDYSLGERTAEELGVAREDFARGCRLALGTNT